MKVSAEDLDWRDAETDEQFVARLNATAWGLTQEELRVAMDRERVLAQARFARQRAVLEEEHRAEVWRHRRVMAGIVLETAWVMIRTLAAPVYALACVLLPLALVVWSVCVLVASHS